ncbi:MAG: TlpA disulfide reductase family protein [Acidimicrobiia bacterium]|nr:MAG: TlpA disulfide reductase family protein [Acidimicrobiia bacterium]
MNRSRLSRRVIIGFFALAVLASACSPTGETTGPSDGSADAELAPHFTVPTASSGEFSLSEHLANDGRPVFLNLWASWCFPCREEMPTIDAASKEFTDVAFIGVAVQDARSDSEKFLEEIGVTYTIGFDDDGAVNRDYNPLGLPASYIISSDGVILERIFGKVTRDDLAEKFAKYFG